MQTESPNSLRCTQCGHEWTPRTKNKPMGHEPRSCPRCKSYAWAKQVTQSEQESAQ